MNRREFAMAGLAAAAAADRDTYASVTGRLAMFTDHLGGFDYAEVARMFREAGIPGPDLTVRPGGLVKPERVERDLPKAVAIFRDAGLTVPMITTGITSLDDPTARPVLATAAKLGIRHFKPGYHPYPDMDDWRATREQVKRELARIVAFSRRVGIHAGFHNHSGPIAGGIVWDALEILAGLDPQWIGLYFDPSHATIEGGKNGWNFSFRRAAERLRMVAVKDFVWEKAGGEWRTRWVPLGQGMVNFPEFFRLLAGTSFPGPLSMHIEYDPGGKTRTERYDRALAAAVRDLAYLKGQLRTAYGAAAT